MDLCVTIIGASSGIGRALARQLRGEVDLVLASRREWELQVLAAELNGRYRVTDVTAPEDCAALAAFAREGSGVPVLVNCAGLASFGSFESVSADSLRQQVEVNLLGTMYACHAFVPWMLEVGRGVIVNVGSVAATTVFSGSTGYCASKAGQLMFDCVLRAELRARGVRVASILPGSTDTELWHDKEWKPERADMLSPIAVAEAIRDLIFLPEDRAVDELLLVPPKGIL